MNTGEMKVMLSGPVECGVCKEPLIIRVCATVARSGSLNDVVE